MEHVEFCGEVVPLDPVRGLVIGREGDLAVDDNPYLHRHFLRIYRYGALWWLANVGSRLSATVSDNTAAMQAHLAPGAHLPLVFATTSVYFSAGSTTYELSIVLDQPVFDAVPQHLPLSGETTVGPLSLTPDQKLLLLALTESALRRGERAGSELPTSAEAAARLGWALTKFNRKLDNVCQKFSRLGVRGLHGAPGILASNRRLRLVEYALAARLVTPADLVLLDAAVESGEPEPVEP